jgi:hypothetical protein
MNINGLLYWSRLSLPEFIAVLTAILRSGFLIATRSVAGVPSGDERNISFTVNCLDHLNALDVQ